MKTPTRTTQSTFLLIWGLVAILLSQNVFSSSLEDQKNFYFPPFPSILAPPLVLSPPIDPSTPPIGYYGSPPPTHGSGGSPPLVLSPPIDPSTPPVGYYGSPPPTHGSGGSQSPPPVHHTPPSHGGGGHHHGGSPSPHHHHGGSPPTNCVNPSPPKHVDPSPGGHHNNPSPSVPTYHHTPPPSGGGSPPTYHHIPPPRSGGGGSGGSPPIYYHSPPPSGGGGGGSGSPPGTYPPIILPPTTPGLPFPSPPFDPNSPPITGGPCDFWRNHPGFIWGVFGWSGQTIGSAFGLGTLPGPGAGANLNLLQALSNTRTDGIGALYREGTASLLNSMVNKHFPYTTSHVKTSFLAAIGSNKAAAAQARVFKLANEGHMKLRV
ncbi:uncharacterized protein [Rutidosis leptorrhynchoides]|uniref:uncharacterized protein n=1 Tax=Rutidosis leptorrhynchoides TaxID=125765 RepID=UPI003A9976DC